jgi:putative chitinase
MSLITLDELRKLMPTLSLAKAGEYLPHLESALEEFEITSKPRRCAFLAQLAHESSQLKYFEEIWGPTAAQKKYEGRLDLGNTEPGDGYRFRGRGPIQLTGRTNYRKFGRSLDLALVVKPELVAQPQHAFRVAGLFWKLHGLNELADALTMQGDALDRKIFTTITRRINGGTNGLTDRLNYFRVAKQVLHGDDDPDGGRVPTASPDSSAAQAESPAEVSPDPDVDLLGAAVSSDKAKSAGLKLWPRIAKQSGAGLTFLWALFEAHKTASILVLLVLIGGVAWLVYHNRRWIKEQKAALKNQVAKWL